VPDPPAKDAQSGVRTHESLEAGVRGAGVREAGVREAGVREAGVRESKVWTSVLPELGSFRRFYQIDGLDGRLFYTTYLRRQVSMLSRRILNNMLKP
jgi:hypothetical protein